MTAVCIQTAVTEVGDSVRAQLLIVAGANTQWSLIVTALR